MYGVFHLKKRKYIMEKQVSVFISIGSNMGNKYDNCLKGVELLKQLDQTSVIEVSPFYQTDPVDFTDQDWFVNGMVKISTSLLPVPLMAALKGIEQALGQFEKSVRFGPRLIDLDIVYYDNLVINEETVILPHPRMHQRRFVLKPLCDIDAHIMHPVLNQTAQSLLDELKEGEQNILPYAPQGALP
ncbi:2-amino-4-hydroxy-6-hydroxymethyldihydropteridinediphosphokinase/dihydroneopterin aldolase / 2-amino-4-hydroxy-6-hydroxymethyldihydropteridine diphosphokinase [Desulfocicer vacuolatum DSM 3385]|uniref:2-amino-4-hydroxy-6-hydroxymethyldihydropteridine pyrophosphokinase n=2 Tax=Desulfocicer vacuolatum TaxID=2298 RepID=A0A1W1ZFX7_9BACT|nr:2-amino-4-hydroxy-6-hydroxymethyldihydropteridinediphosphokinase/dihydroneopterin aldolase / 2-amino-4-hydroxy-6-hydroxymethyldihydropteridine diphosphokinase [Desulfocicer vacuolatum DSM 3385]